MNDTKIAIIEQAKTMERTPFRKRSSYIKNTYFMSRTYEKCVCECVCE